MACGPGYRVRDLLAAAGVHSDADMVLSTSSDGFTAGTPVEALTDDRDSLLAITLDGQPLPVEHGYPARLVVPGLYGYVSATKWIVDLEVTRYDRAESYWTRLGWSPRGPIKTESRIDVPRSGAGRCARPDAVRRRGMGAAPRRQGRRGPNRRRPMATRSTRCGVQRRHLAAVELRLAGRPDRKPSRSRCGPPTTPERCRRRMRQTSFPMAPRAGTRSPSRCANRIGPRAVGSPATTVNRDDRACHPFGARPCGRSCSRPARSVMPFRVSALRSALSVYRQRRDASRRTTPKDVPDARSPSRAAMQGLRAAEVSRRRVVTDAEIRDLLRAEHDELLAAAELMDYGRAGRCRRPRRAPKRQSSPTCSAHADPPACRTVVPGWAGAAPRRRDGIRRSRCGRCALGQVAPASPNC